MFYFGEIQISPKISFLTSTTDRSIKHTDCCDLGRHPQNILRRYLLPQFKLLSRDEGNVFLQNVSLNISFNSTLITFYFLNISTKTGFARLQNNELMN